MSRQKAIIIAATVGVSALNFAAGYYTAKRILEPKYVKISEQEIADAKIFYSRLYKKDEFADPVEMVTAKEIITDLKYKPPVAIFNEEIREVITPEELSADDELINEIELAKEHGHPYVISRHEFMANDTDFAQMTLTYFEEDDVLVDSDDTPIEYIEDTVGLNQMSRFGVMSEDNNIVYVRNPAREIEFEIIRNKGNYAKDVLGFIEHSDEVRVRKFRRDYE